MASYPYDPQTFDGKKFRERYNLTYADYYASGGLLHVREGITLPDDPPIFEAPDSLIDRLRGAAVQLADAPDPSNKVLRAVLAALLDELNLHAAKINSILSAVDAATSLADLKNRVGQINDYPQRTMAQAVSAVKNRINDGTAD